MKALILCGGFGTRYNKKNKTKVLKPLLKVNGLSILERIIILYSKQGVKDFLLLGGFNFDKLEKFVKKFKKLNIRAINTGLYTNTAGRLLKAKKLINKGENFLFTYGDSLADFNLRKNLKIKKNNNYTVCAYNYKIPYGGLKLDSKNNLKQIQEKKTIIPINAGFYILDESIFSYIKGSKESFEKTTINKVIDGKKNSFKCSYVRKWFPLDTFKDKIALNKYLKKHNEFL